MFNFSLISSPKLIETQAVLIITKDFQKIMHKQQIIRRANRTFKNTILYTLTIFHTDFRHGTKPSFPRRRLRVHIIRNDNHHVTSLQPYGIIST